MAKQKKNIFKRAGAFIESVLFQDLPETEKEKRIRKEKEAERQEEERQYHEKTMNQEGMAEFMDVFNSAKTINVYLDKSYKPSWPLFEESTSDLGYEIGKYKIRSKYNKMDIGGYVFVDGEMVLYLDKELFTMIKKRAKELNPKGVEKCEQEAKEWDGKQKFILAHGKDR